MSILETGSVLKTTDFDVHCCSQSVKPVARRPNAKASSTARGSTRNELSDRNDVGAARPVGQPFDQGWQQHHHFARQPLQPPPTTQQQHLQLGSADFIPAPNNTRIRQRTGQHPLGWQ
ncbi:hypothetical protein E4U48_005625 [Claviceps purpurea]|nr:hypothetical protein E4U23_005942 [Claviceps purpurea]KAG6266173.1 hypothetical protein E4U48_005625 [Claviceps purpurea]